MDTNGKSGRKKALRARVKKYVVKVNYVDRTWRAGLLHNRHFPGAGIDWGFL